MPSLCRDEVKLFYKLAVGIKQPVLLVHGWCCDHTYLQPQLEHFQGLGHTVVAVDLRGHGQSDKPQQSYTMQVFADDLAWMIGELELAPPVVVGHSMGGIVAYDMARRHRDRVTAIAILDAAVALSTASRSAIPAFLEALQGTDYQERVQRYVDEVLFLPTDDPDLRQRILKAMAGSPQHVAVSAFEGLRDFDPADTGLSMTAPALYIEADERVPRSDISRLLQLAPQTLFGRVVGSGHFCQLEVPGQVNAMLDRFLTLTLT